MDTYGCAPIRVHPLLPLSLSKVTLFRGTGTVRRAARTDGSRLLFHVNMFTLLYFSFLFFVFRSMSNR